MQSRLMRERRGSALVEFALVAPILIFILIATVVLGLTINSKIVVSGAAREAARSYSIHQDREAARLKAREAILGGGLRERFRGRTLFDYRRDVEIRTSDYYVTVTVTYRQPTFVPLLPKLLDPDAGPWDDLATLRSSAVFRLEGVDR